LTGKRFGRLVVLGPSRLRNSGGVAVVWDMSCDCGKAHDRHIQRFCVPAIRGYEVRIAFHRAAPQQKQMNKIPSSNSGRPIEARRDKQIRGKTPNGSVPIVGFVPKQVGASMHKSSHPAPLVFMGRLGVGIVLRGVSEHGFENFLSDMGSAPSRITRLGRWFLRIGNMKKGPCAWMKRLNRSPSQQKKRKISDEIVRQGLQTSRGKKGS